MKSISIFLLVVVVAGVIGVLLSAYTVDETQHVVITRFGEITEVHSTPGLKFRAPFIDQVNVLDKRILRIDVPPTSMPDVDNQFLQMDAYVRYKIIDPRKFLEKLRSEITAESRIGSIVIAALRDEIGRSTQPEIIGGELLGIEEDRTVVQPLTVDGTPGGTPTRVAIVEAALASADATVKAQENDFGIEIVDLRIKRADFPQATEENIFNRMRTERAVQAGKLRAEGEEEFRTRVADVDRLVEIISAEADQKADQLRGEGEGKAIAILAGALGEDPEFFSFLRSLEAYKVFLRQNTTVVLPTSSDLFQFLQSPDAK
jgi:membrane protease subunit HflC